MRNVVVGTRRSALATTQTGHIVEALRRAHPDLSVSTCEILTKGDRIQDVALSKVGGKGLFITEIEDALRGAKVDLAVHSMKDVPAVLAHGLVIGAVPKREDPRDVLLSSAGYTLATLPEGAVVGTSSLRRSAQLQKLRPDLRIEPLRGNIDTRLRKLQAPSAFSAIVLAAAGLVRMGWWDAQTGQVAHHELIGRALSFDEVLPAVGQGALCVECRADDETLLQLLSPLHDPDTADCARAERAFLAAVGGSCQVPVAGLAEVVGRDGAVRQMRLRALIGAPDGSQVTAFSATGTDPQALGVSVGEQLLKAGGREILAALS
ncbi:MAG: hydroxymethylbilane synthase [Firmicutes bacterium]|nr:hydroxymethylbilane synthase [Bacillota bacterium]